MQGLLIIVFLAVTLSEFVITLAGWPPALRFVCEGLSAIVMLYVIFAGTRDRFRLVAPKYWLAFGALTVVILCGILNNPSGAGPMLSGARFFLRAVPFFLLPAVLPTKDRQLKWQLLVLTGIGLLQLPLSLYQRWVVLEAGRYSGDDVRGTLLDSGILSIYEICAVAVLTGLLMKGRISKLKYGAMFLLLLVPTAINETKVTVVLLPLGLMVALIMGSEPRKRMQYAALGVMALVVFGALFVPVYNKMEEFNPYKKQQDITNYFTDQKNLTRYMSSGVSGLGTKLNVRRGDAISIPLQYLAKDPVTLAFGLGLGSVSPASLGKGSEGPYFGLFEKFMLTSFTYFVLQVGILGVIVIAFLFWLVFLDCLAVARTDMTLVGAVASGWSGVVAIVSLCTIYNVYHDFASITYLYAYLSGVICARRVSLDLGDDPRSYA